MFLRQLCIALTILIAGPAPVSGLPAIVPETSSAAKPGAFALNDHEGKAVRLGDGQGHGWFVLAFFPKAMTGG